MKNEFNFDTDGFDMPEFDTDLFGAEAGVNLSTRHHRPAKQKTIPDSKVKYRNAQALAKDMPAVSGMWHICLIDGSFIAGDFIEAFVKHNNLHAKRISISTLSLNQENVDSLGNLLLDGWCDEMELIVSDGFWANYRNDIIPYIYAELDVPDNRFQLAVARVHTKVTLIETHCGMKIVFRGSANLRSSACIEHLEVQESPDIFDFFAEFHASIVQAFSTINKNEPSIYKKKMLTKTGTWQAVT
jgi:hypothetical protein